MKPLVELCQPDRRQYGTVGIVTDYYAAIEAVVLADAVPDDVRTQFEVARNLMLYGWFVYEFYTVASNQALASLEYGLREACQIVNGGMNPCAKKSGLMCYLKEATKLGLVPAGKYHDKLAFVLSSFRNSMAHGGYTLLNYAMAMPNLEVSADLLNDVFNSEKVSACRPR